MKIVDLPSPTQNGVPRDGNDKPVVVPETGGKPKALTRVTTFIDCIEDKSNLATWKMRMVLLGVARQPSLLDALQGLDPDDPDDKRKINALAERAADIAGANEKSEQGTHLHGLSELVDAGKPLPPDISDADLADMAEYMLATVYLTPAYREEFVVCDELGVGGTPDGVSFYDGPGPDGLPFSALIIDDLKTGSVEYGGLKMPAQLAIYSRSKKYDHTVFPAPDRRQDEKAWKKWRSTIVPAEEAVKAYSPIGDVNREWGLIVHLPSGKAKAELHWANLTLGWELAKMALDIRRMRSRAKEGLHPWVPLITAAESESVVAGV